MEGSSNGVAGSARRGRSRPIVDAGFTLIEVMVVVMIIGILITVGSPAFLGARERVWDISAQSSLRTAMSSAILASDFRSDFTLASPASLGAIEPGLSFVAAGEKSTGPKVVSVDSSGRGRWAAAILSNSGACFAVVIGVGGQIFPDADTCAASEVGEDAPGPNWSGDDSSSGSTPTTAPVARLSVSASEAALSGDMRLSDGFVSVVDGTGSNFDGPDGTTSSATFVFDVTEAGLYKILGSVKAPSGTADSFYVMVSGQSGYFTWGVSGTSPDFVNDGNGARPDVELLFEPGRYTVTLYLREDGTMVSGLQLVPS